MGTIPFTGHNLLSPWVTRNTRLLREICSQLNPSTKNLGCPISCSSFLGNQGPARELAKPQWDQVKPCGSVSLLSALREQETTPETRSPAKLPAQLPARCVCRAPSIWAPQSRNAFRARPHPIDRSRSLFTLFHKGFSKGLFWPLLFFSSLFFSVLPPSFSL